MYCPKCNRSLDKEQVAQKNELLKDKFGVSSLEQGVCPVCGTKLIDTEKM